MVSPGDIAAAVIIARNATKKTPRKEKKEKKKKGK